MTSGEPLLVTFGQLDHILDGDGFCWCEPTYVRAVDEDIDEVLDGGFWIHKDTTPGALQ